MPTRGRFPIKKLRKRIVLRINVTELALSTQLPSSKKGKVRKGLGAVIDGLLSSVTVLGAHGPLLTLN